MTNSVGAISRSRTRDAARPDRGQHNTGALEASDEAASRHRGRTSLSWRSRHRYWPVPSGRRSCGSHSRCAERRSAGAEETACLSGVG